MRTPPPAVPGIAEANSKPPSPASRARCRQTALAAPPPATSIVPSTRASASSPASRSTSASTPSSCTSRFEPRPIVSTATPSPARPREQLLELGERARPREEPRRPAGAERRVARERNAFLDRRGRDSSHRGPPPTRRAPLYPWPRLWSEPMPKQWYGPVARARAEAARRAAHGTTLGAPRARPSSSATRYVGSEHLLLALVAPGETSVGCTGASRVRRRVRRAARRDRRERQRPARRPRALEDAAARPSTSSRDGPTASRPRSARSRSSPSTFCSRSSGRSTAARRSHPRSARHLDARRAEQAREARRERCRRAARPPPTTRAGARTSPLRIPPSSDAWELASLDPAAPARGRPDRLQLQPARRSGSTPARGSTSAPIVRKARTAAAGRPAPCILRPKSSSRPWPGRARRPTVGETAIVVLVPEAEPLLGEHRRAAHRGGRARHGRARDAALSVRATRRCSTWSASPR